MLLEIEKTIKDFDLAVLRWIAEHSIKSMDEIFMLVTWMGSIYFLAPIIILISSILLYQHRKTDALLLTVSLAAAAIVSRGIKFLIGRERPDLYPAMVDTYTELAFPSVHATQISTSCVALYIVMTRSKMTGYRVAGVILLILALIVMSSRIALQVHYPSDVIAGALLGIISAIVASRIFNYDK